LVYDTSSCCECQWLVYMSASSLCCLVAEDFLTSKKGDPQHDPTANSCLVRIPGTINSKCAQLTRHLVNREEQAKLIAQTSRVISTINEGTDNFHMLICSPAAVTSQYEIINGLIPFLHNLLE
jgi:hypothetical protein